MSKKKKEKSRTGSSNGYFYKNGQYFAVPAKKVKKKVFHEEKKFMGVSSYRSSFKPLTTKKGKKPLVSYKANCARRKHYKPEKSRPKIKKNDSTIEFGNEAMNRTRFRTLNKVTFNSKTGTVPTGFSNQAVISEKTKWIHKRQLD